MKDFFNIYSLDLSGIVIVFIIASLIIAIAGTYLAKFADQIADVTKMGEALVGAILLGAVTSLAGVVTSLSAAIQGHPDLAVSNAIGGITAQTFFLGIGTGRRVKKRSYQIRKCIVAYIAHYFDRNNKKISKPEKKATTDGSKLLIQKKSHS